MKTYSFVITCMTIITALQADPVVVINGAPIDNTIIDRQLQQFVGRVTVEEFRRKRLELIIQTIEMHLKREFAATLKHIEVSEKEIDLSLHEIRKSLEKDPNLKGLSFEEVLAFQGISIAELRERQANNIRYLKYLETLVNEEDCRKMYEAAPEAFDGSQVRVSQLFFDISKATDEEVENVRQTAEKVRERLAADENRLIFEQLLPKESSETGIRFSGDLGYFSKIGVMPELISNTAFELHIGEISDVLQTVEGFHIIKVTDKRTGSRTSYEECLPHIKNYLLFTADRELVQSLIRKADIVFPTPAAQEQPLQNNTDSEPDTATED